MTILDIATAIIFLCVFLAAWVFLDISFPHDISGKRVGGLYHWRFGRLGGSVYFSRKAR